MFKKIATILATIWFGAVIAVSGAETGRVTLAGHVPAGIAHPKCPLPSDRLARAGRPPGHEFIARERLVDGFARGLDARHRQARRIE